MQAATQSMVDYAKKKNVSLTTGLAKGTVGKKVFGFVGVHACCIGPLVRRAREESRSSTTT